MYGILTKCPNFTRYLSDFLREGGGLREQMSPIPVCQAYERHQTSKRDWFSFIQNKLLTGFKKSAATIARCRILSLMCVKSFITIGWETTKPWYIENQITTTQRTRTTRTTLVRVWGPVSGLKNLQRKICAFSSDWRFDVAQWRQTLFYPSPDQLAAGVNTHIPVQNN